MEIVFKIHDVECRYGAHPVIKGMNLEIPKGSFVGIIGPNAAGKSTLLKTLAATLKPVCGVVWFRGEDVHKIPKRDLAREVAVVPQESSFAFPFSAHDVVLMGRHPHQGRLSRTTPRDLAVVRAAMEATDCWHLRERSILELSGGERQRVVLARALAQEPDVILLDEPIAHLDLSAQLEILDVLKEMNRDKGLTVVAIFHDLNLAAQYSDSLILLHRGEIYAAGAPEEVLTPGNIRDVYGAEVLVVRHPLAGIPQVIPLGRVDINAGSDCRLRLHLICGGGTGARLMGQLVRMGYQVSAGVLNIKDTDWEVARMLGVPVAEEKPFSAIGEESYRKNLELAMEADAVFLLETPFGHGNLRNLLVLEPLLEAGKRCYLVDPDHLAERDYSGADVAAIASRLFSKGLRCLSRQEDVFQVVKELSDSSSKE
ncbi:MAG: heme ABC transporter ATP-binding protein [Thermacetogeniaceae bacterium]